MRARTLLAMAITLMLIAVIAAVATAGEKRSGPMRSLPGFAVIDDTSVSVNAIAGKANITVRTSGLTAGHAYTLWSISFSHPENCQHGDVGLGLACGIGDDGPGTQGFTMQLVSGHIIGASGKANFGGLGPGRQRRSCRVSHRRGGARRQGSLAVARADQNPGTRDADRLHRPLILAVVASRPVPLGAGHPMSPAVPGRFRPGWYACGLSRLAICHVAVTPADGLVSQACRPL